jgi:hypothetical protein
MRLITALVQGLNRNGRKSGFSARSRDQSRGACPDLHVRGRARLLRRFVEATADLGRENKLIFEMWNVFEKDYFMIESDVIEENEVLM